MNIFTKTFSKIFKSGNQQELDRIKPIVNAINEKRLFSSLKENDFKEKTFELKKSVKNGKNLNDAIPESLL